MNYDDWKFLPSYKKGGKLDLSHLCKCGKRKNLADCFCDECREIWKKKFNK